MRDRLERFALLAGALAALLWIVSLFVLEGAGNPADPARGDEIAEFYRDNRVPILIAATLHTLGGFLFLWFLAALASVLDAAGSPTWLRRAAVIGGTAGGAMMLAMTGGQSTGATTDSELLTPDTAIVFWRLAHGFFVAAEVALAVFLGALSILALRGLVLPRWLGWAGLVITILLLIPPIGWAALLFLLPLWLIAASVILWRRSVAPAELPAAA
ncbi:MAG: hypothetical protein M3310_01920 [Actinomycetota bacterium]|nr:hypothetical protein [Actinomycetota bacterium]